MRIKVIHLIIFFCNITLIAQSIQGVNQNFNSFLEYSKSAFQKDTIVLYRPYEKPLKIAIVKDNYGFKASYKGFFEYKEEVLRKDGYYTGRVIIRVFTDYRFRLEIEHTLKNTTVNPYFMIPGVFYGTKNENNLKLNTTVFQTRADRSTHPSIIVITKNQTSMIGFQETIIGNDTLVRNSPLEPLCLYNGICINTIPENTNKIGFSIGYKHQPIRLKGIQNSNNLISFDTSHTEGWIEKKMGKVLSFKTLYDVKNSYQSLESYQNAIQCYHSELGQKPIPRSKKSEALNKIKNAMLKSDWPTSSFESKPNEDTNFTLLDESIIAYALLLNDKKKNDSITKKIASNYFNIICTEAKDKYLGYLFEKKYKNNYLLGPRKGIKMNQKDSCIFAFSTKKQGLLAYFLLKSFQIFPQHNEIWLNTATNILDKFATQINSNQTIPEYICANSGKGFQYSYTNSMWMAAAYAILYDISNNIKYLNLAEKITKNYYNYSKKNNTNFPNIRNYMLSGPQDNIAFIKSCYELHKLTKNMEYMHKAMDAIHYVFTYNYCFNSKHSSYPLLGLLFPTSGGTLADYPKIGLDAFGNLIALEIYYFYTISKDNYLQNRLKNLCLWGLSTYNTKDEELGFGKTGIVPTIFYISDASKDPQSWDGSVEKTNSIIPAACILLNLSEEIPDTFFE